MFYAIAGAFFLGALLSGFATHSITANSFLAEAGRETRKMDAIFKANNERIDKLAQDLEVAKSAKNIEYQKVTKFVTKVVEKPVYKLECIDDDGLRAVNAIISGGSLDTGESPAAMPAGHDSGRQDREGLIAEAAGAVEAPK